MEVAAILELYAQGYFPLGFKDGVGWFDQRAYGTSLRALMPLDGRFHVPRSLRRALNSGRFETRIDADFMGVVEGCATRGWSYHSETWLTPELAQMYLRLHRAGFAHSFECWLGGELAGGILGLALGGAFIGDSMFYAVPEASKVALVRLVQHLRARGFLLFDVQVQNPHLERFGAYQVALREYRRMLQEAMALPVRFI